MTTDIGVGVSFGSLDSIRHRWDCCDSGKFGVLTTFELVASRDQVAPDFVHAIDAGIAHSTASTNVAYRGILDRTTAAVALYDHG